MLRPNANIIEECCRSIGKEPNILQIQKTVNVNCIRLDGIINDLNINFDFIKTDAQGVDLEVIKSLGKYLDEQIIGVHIELLFKPLYEGSSLFNKADVFLKEHGFYLIKSINRRKNPFFDDFLYIRRDVSKKKKIKFIRKIYKA